MSQTLSDCLLLMVCLFCVLIVRPVHNAPSDASNCNEKSITNDQVPFYRLGDIGRDLAPACNRAITEKLHQCHIEYLEAIKKTYLSVKCYPGSETVKKTKCCALWDAKKCMVQAAKTTEACQDSNVTESYSKLPVRSEEKMQLADQCSEYREGSPICQPPQSSGISLGTFTILLLVLMAIPFIIVGILKARDLYEAHKNGNTVIVVASRRPSKTYQLYNDVKEYHDDEPTKDAEKLVEEPPKITEMKQETPLLPNKDEQAQKISPEIIPEQSEPHPEQVTNEVVHGRLVQPTRLISTDDEES